MEKKRTTLTHWWPLLLLLSIVFTGAGIFGVTVQWDGALGIAMSLCAFVLLAQFVLFFIALWQREWWRALAFFLSCLISCALLSFSISLQILGDAMEKAYIPEGEVVDSLTAEMAYEGVSNYCHSAYDWSAAEENPSIMDVSMGEESDSAYQVVFRSYTGAMVYFYVNKTSGSTRMEEYVPALDITSEAGTFDLFEYLEKK